MMKRFLLLFSLLLFILTAGIQYLYDSQQNYFDTKQIVVNLPDSKTLKLLSAGYDHLVGDLLYIWAIQLYSSYNITNGYDYIEQVFNTITDLIPEYRSPYIVGAMVIALEKDDPEMAIRFLQRASDNNPDEWYFDFEAGFYAFERLKDYELAEKLFKRASEKPGAPEFLKRRAAHMVYMSDNLEKSWELWKDIEKNATDKFQKQAAANHLYQIKFESDKKIIDKIIEAFKKRFNRYPHSLEELVEKRMIRAVPMDYRGNSYLYDNKTGKFAARKMLSWKKFL